MINCTEFGAYIENWNHIALDHTHPAIKSVMIPLTL